MLLPALRLALAGRRGSARLHLAATSGLAVSAYRHGGRAFSRYQAQRRGEKKRKVAQFAECLADGMTITAAARSCAVSQQTGSIYFREICEALGWQAR